jgi:hypothetical protein
MLLLTAVDALRNALATHRQASDPCHGLRPIAQRLTQHAKANGMRAEHVIVLVKRLWEAVPEGRRLEPASGKALRERLISMCIDDYYAGEPA